VVTLVIDRIELVEERSCRKERKALERQKGNVDRIEVAVVGSCRPEEAYRIVGIEVEVEIEIENLLHVEVVVEVGIRLLED
jgi:hypothetical protein